MNIHSLRFRMAAWYAAVLVGTIVLFGFAIYVGLDQYLEQTLRSTVRHQAMDISINVAKMDRKGESWFANEMNEDFDNNKMFLRVTRPDGSLMYQSASPADKSFDPSSVPAIAMPVRSATDADRALPDGRRVIIEAMPVAAA